MELLASDGSTLSYTFSMCMYFSALWYFHVPRRLIIKPIETIRLIPHASYLLPELVSRESGNQTPTSHTPGSARPLMVLVLAVIATIFAIPTTYNSTDSFEHTTYRSHIPGSLIDLSVYSRRLVSSVQSRALELAKLESSELAWRSGPDLEHGQDCSHGCSNLVQGFLVLHLPGLQISDLITSRLVNMHFPGRRWTSSYRVPMVSLLSTCSGRLLVIVVASDFVEKSPVCLAYDLEGTVVGLFWLLMNNITYWK
ncbi:hypothetical protein TorRG33x02_303740 [Trema orientale]|uniref:Transmembrane protein n=1 Tax=Trema orientale TaxID=63057 RepID=A0A2P5BZ15_TREOI|nr:hypothetical protein TorRG33x02_303740 [Trema orientale]